VIALDCASLAAALAAIVLAGLRWLRVAQREHYLPGSAIRFAARWWKSTPVNVALLLAGVAGAVASGVVPALGLVAAASAAAGPRGLGVRGRTSRLAWTRRLTTVAATAAGLSAFAVLTGALVGGLAGAVLAAAATAMATPLVTDAALAVTRPVEDALAQRYVRRAVARLQRVRPVVVAVTGSYGKTTTKGYIAHLVGPFRSTVPSPHSFNNRAGLARTVNENLGPGTEVLVAEMGTYGPGEIAEMCSWLHPEIAVITAIGPAHLERFKSLDATLRAKAEITEAAPVAVLNVDDERLAGLAGQLEASGKEVVRASGLSEVADVAVVAVPGGLDLWIAGDRVGQAEVGDADRPLALSNAACAAAVALRLGVGPGDVLDRLASLPILANRLQPYTAEGGYLVLDDAFNSNPAGARLALSRLHQQVTQGRRVLVTPGMVELGRAQYEENAAFAEAAAAVASEIVVVARTNRRALEDGARRASAGAVVLLARTLDEALERVRSTLGAGDVVLFENDLPDHFP
jgi:UDP-N-acetylmuramoyl-tripeptide--D-alanyl-D-alanine ligase